MRPLAKLPLKDLDIRWYLVNGDSGLRVARLCRAFAKRLKDGLQNGSVTEVLEDEAVVSKIMLV